MAAADVGPNLKSALKSLSSLRSFTRNGSKATGQGSRFVRAPDVAELFEAQDIQLTREKCRAAALGALVADAAGAGLYGLRFEQLQELVSEDAFKEHPEFFKPQGKARRHSRGSLSPAGDALLPLLQSVVYHGGLDGPHYTQTSFNFFKQYSGQKSELTKRFMTSVERGSTFPAGVAVNTLECLTKVPILVARYAGKPELAAKVRDAVRAHQSSPEVLSLSVALAKILERVVLGCTILEALSWAQQSPMLDSTAHKGIQTVLQSLSVPHSAFVAKRGRSEHLPGAFLGALHAAAIASSYQDGVRQTLKAGGASCGRAQLVGSLLAAEDCMEAIPLNWTEQILKFPEYSDTVNKLVSQRVVVSIWSP